MSIIIAAKTSYPEYQYSQTEIAKFLSSIFVDKESVIHKIFKNALVEKRRFSIPLEKYTELTGLQKRNEFWIHEALKLQKINLDYFFNELNFPIQDIGMIISTSITGLSIPSVEAKLMNQFSFSKKTKRIPIFGLGCLAGVACIARAHDYLLHYKKEAVLILATELCSLTFQLDDFSMANLVGTSLFADGAGAVLIVGSEHPWASKGRYQINSVESIFFENTERMMGWDIKDTGFKLVLSGDVPKLVSDHLVPSLKSFLQVKKLGTKDIKFYISHPGGPKVLSAIEDSLEITHEQLKYSYQSLAEHGNMSSVSVINVLEETMLIQHSEFKDQFGLMLAMGPAFCAELVLLKGL